MDTENNSNVFNKITSPIEGSLVLEQDMECNAENMADDWLKFELPGPSGTLCENNNHVFFCDDRENVFYSEVSQSKLVWKKAKFHASTVSTSTDGTVVWRIHQVNKFCEIYILLTGCDVLCLKLYLMLIFKPGHCMVFDQS